jgi:hypothetical protein
METRLTAARLTVSLFCTVRLAPEAVRCDPDEFAAHVSTLRDLELAKWWSRTSFEGFIAGSSAGLVNEAFVALNHWSAELSVGRMSSQNQGIQGAAITVARGIVAANEGSYEITRRFGKLFHSQNIDVAFCAVRQFDNFILSSYSIFVIDHLIAVAAERVEPDSPNPMTLRAISFKVLFDLEPNFRTFSSLSAGYEECVIGCRAWALDGRQHYRDTLQKLLQYRALK